MRILGLAELFYERSKFEEIRANFNNLTQVELFALEDELKSEMQARREAQVISEEMKECTFKPEIFSKTEEFGVDRTLILYEMVKPGGPYGMDKRRDRDRNEVEYEKQIQECTFHPKTTNYSFTKERLSPNGRGLLRNATSKTSLLHQSEIMTSSQVAVPGPPQVPERASPVAQHHAGGSPMKVRDNNRAAALPGHARVPSTQIVKHGPAYTKAAKLAKNYSTAAVAAAGKKAPERAKPATATVAKKPVAMTASGNHVRKVSKFVRGAAKHSDKENGESMKKEQEKLAPTVLCVDINMGNGVVEQLIIDQYSDCSKIALDFAALHSKSTQFR
jgi:hypothetical protein